MRQSISEITLESTKFDLDEQRACATRKLATIREGKWLKFSGDRANADNVLLFQGYDEKDDLKQLVYSLSITRDGAIPIHF